MRTPTNTVGAPLVISDQQVTDFLHATNPCYANMPTEMRESVREYLQRQVDNGDLTECHLQEHARRASETRFMGD